MVSPSDLDKQKQGDLEVIAALKKAGSNLSKEHYIEHHFVCPTREAAQRIHAWGVEHGYSVSEIAEGDYDGHVYWYFDFIIPTVPTIEAVFADTSRFFTLAAGLGAEYDGWGCPVVR